MHAHAVDVAGVHAMLAEGKDKGPVRHECRTTAEATCLCGCKTNKKKSM